MKLRILTTTIDIVKVGIVTALTVFIGSGLLFGAIKTFDTIQTENLPACEQQTVPECMYDGQKPVPGFICTNPRTPCSLDTSGKKDDDNTIGGKQ